MVLVAATPLHPLHDPDGCDRRRSLPDAHAASDCSIHGTPQHAMWEPTCPTNTVDLSDVTFNAVHATAALLPGVPSSRMIAQQAPHASTSSLAAAAPPVLSELIAHGVKDSLVMKRCVIDKLQPLCDQWYKMLSRMSKVFEVRCGVVSFVGPPTSNLAA